MSEQNLDRPPDKSRSDDQVDLFLATVVQARLLQEGWTGSDFQMFISPECTTLRSFALSNVRSRRKA